MTHLRFLAGLVFGSVILCQDMTAIAQAPHQSDTTNPLLEKWTTPFGIPPFEKIKNEHFEPAMRESMRLQLEQVDEIATSKEKPSFANTLEALEGSGRMLDRCKGVFENLTEAETSDELQEIAKRLAPLQAAHEDAILLNGKLFARIRSLWEARESLSLDPDQKTLLERIYREFVRGGALLDPAQKKRLSEINSELATLSVVYGDNVLNEMNDYKLVIEDRTRLKGLPDDLIAQAADAAKEAGMEGKWVFTLHFPSIWPFLTYSEDRDLRRQLFTAYITRGDHNNARDNKAVAAKMAKLRAEKSRMLGYQTWAHFALDEEMAATPEAVYKLLNQMWLPGKRAAGKELEAMKAAATAAGQPADIQPWDWFYYADKVRRAQFDFDETVLRPYFKLEAVRDGAFEVARRLYGITFTALNNVPTYHKEARAFEVKEANGAHVGIFYTDWHPRSGKRPGAWCSGFRYARHEDGKPVRPIIANVCNFSRPSPGTPALLTAEEVETLFHEFGHALHALLSKVRYPSLGETPADFVEMPSQIMENWALHPEVLKLYARHHKTGEPIPAELVEKLKKSELFNVGFRTVEYIAASFLDMEWHTLPVAAEPDAQVLESVALARMSLPAYIVPRYRSTYFQHIFSGGYSAGYYSYLWAEVLDADAFGAFEENGLFDKTTADSFRQNILEQGYNERPMVLYERFRGRAPKVEYLLKRKGFAETQ
jgi:peptidyl-dipeptidase Dcp